ncbi:MAG: nucleotidyltransferase family protein [Oscillochloridaceae bacterium umkhey_bin13]
MGMPSLVKLVGAVITGRVVTRSLGVDWTTEQWCALVALARNHGVAGLLLRAFSTNGWPTAMPIEVRGELQALVYEATGHNLKLFMALAPILAVLNPLTPVLVLKGAALSEPYYHGTILRPISDLDLLVPEDAVPAVLAALAQLGYHPIPSLAPELLPALEPHVHLSGGPQGDLQLEIHWSLVSGSADWRASPVTWFWTQQQAWLPPRAYLEAGGEVGRATCLTATASLLYQAAHLVLRHGQEPARLIWIYDLHLLVSSGQIDWPLLVQQAQALGWEVALTTALDESQRYFETGVPEEVLAQLRHSFDARVIYTGPDAPYVPLNSWDMLQPLRMRTRLHMLLRLAFPDPNYLRASYAPAWGHWWPLAYPYRWLKPFMRLARRLVRPNPTRSPWLR